MTEPAIVTVERDIAATRERVFDAWIDPFLSIRTCALVDIGP